MDLEGQISPIDLGHSQIGNHYVGPQSRKYFRRLQCIRGLGNFVALPFEYICKEKPITWFIIYNEDHKEAFAI